MAGGGKHKLHRIKIDILNKEIKLINYQLFPRSVAITQEIRQIIDCFEIIADEIDSETHEKLNSNTVLKLLEPHLQKIGFDVETGKSASQMIQVPVLFGKNNNIDKYFNADALSKDGRIVMEVEAGRAIANNQFLKDIFEASCMFNVEYLVLAVRNIYQPLHNSKDFELVYTFLETLYISNRIKLPMKGILLVGY